MKLDRSWRATTGIFLRLVMCVCAFGLPALVGQTQALGQNRPVGSDPRAETALKQAKAFLTAYDASFTRKTHHSAAKYVLHDDCYLGDGYTKPVLISLFEADPKAGVAADGYRERAKSTNVEILADRTSINADGSSRRELDLKYQINYADGTVDPDVHDTLISGSSAGSVMVPGTLCSTPQTGGHWRMFGNRMAIFAQVRAVNERDENFNWVTGVRRSVTYSKAIQFRIVDPSDFAKYVVITGPGLPESGVKMLSVRLLREDPRLAGKTGNFVDWLDTDNFRFCRNNNGSASVANTAAETADCLSYGATSTLLGANGFSSATAADSAFDAMGFEAGGTYQVAVYDDDGWTTPNGHDGHTPIATYTPTLRFLPYSAATLAGTGADHDLFPRITSSSLTAAQIGEAYRTKSAFTLDFGFTALATMPDAAKFGLLDVFSYVSGTTLDSAPFWPGSRQLWLSFPDSGATAVKNFMSPAPDSVLVTPNFGELGIEMSNRNGRRIWSYFNYY